MNLIEHAQEAFKIHGGKGSGNFHHIGRPGIVGGSGGGGMFIAGDWKEKEVGERKEAWGDLSVRQRDRMANASDSIRERVSTVTDYAGERPEHTGNIQNAIEDRAYQLRELVPSDATEQIITTAKTLDKHLEEAGVPSELRHKMAMDAVDTMMVQENEALGRSLGDHGINHIQGNIDMSMGMMKAIPGEETARDKAAIHIAAIYHDTGYVAAPSHYFLDEGHPRWSMQHYNENIKGDVAKAIGKRQAEEIAHIIRTHDSTEINWSEDPAGSSFRTADNLALFSKVKTPGVFRYVPENLAVLESMASGKISVSKAQSAMIKNIENTSYNKWIKHELSRSVGEVSPILPKFTLGMKAGRVSNFSWESNDHIKVSIKRTPQYDNLMKSLDLGQSQFTKLAKTYGIDPGKFKSDLSFSYKNQGGSTLLEGIVINKELESIFDFSKDNGM